MFGLFKKKIREHVDFSGLVADMHNHLIPGIDDGATDLESSIVMIRAMHRLGYRKFVATPHLHWEMFKNTNEIIENGAKLVRDRLAETEMKVEFRELRNISWMNMWMNFWKKIFPYLPFIEIWCWSSSLL